MGRRSADFDTWPDSISLPAPPSSSWHGSHGPCVCYWRLNIHGGTDPKKWPFTWWRMTWEEPAGVSGNKLLFFSTSSSRKCPVPSSSPMCGTSAIYLVNWSFWSGRQSQLPSRKTKTLLDGWTCWTGPEMDRPVFYLLSSEEKKEFYLKCSLLLRSNWLRFTNCTAFKS